MLAQAQRCFFERASSDQMKPAVVAKLAMQTAKYYEHAAAMLRELKAGSLEKMLSHLEVGHKVFEAYAQFYAAAEHEAAYEYGMQVSRLEGAATLIVEAARLSPRAFVTRILRHDHRRRRRHHAQARARVAPERHCLQRAGAATRHAAALGDQEHRQAAARD